MKSLEIVPRNGSHYLILDGLEISRHDDVRIAEAVRAEMLRQQFSLDSADGGSELTQKEKRAGQSQAEPTLLINHDNRIIVRER